MNVVLVTADLPNCLPPSLLGGVPLRTQRLCCDAAKIVGEAHLSSLHRGDCNGKKRGQQKERIVTRDPRTLTICGVKWEFMKFGDASTL